MPAPANCRRRIMKVAVSIGRLATIECRHGWQLPATAAFWREIHCSRSEPAAESLAATAGRRLNAPFRPAAALHPAGQAVTKSRHTAANGADLGPPASQPKDQGMWGDASFVREVAGACDAYGCRVDETAAPPRDRRRT